MKTVTISILDSEEEAVMRQLDQWQQRRAVRYETIDPLIFPADAPLTPEEWEYELKRALASGSVTLTKEQALARFGL